eukprot:scaffold319217_cov35-Attheya_sp.AAC.1
MKYRIMKEGKVKVGKESALTSDKCKKLENIGFAFVSPSTNARWDQHWDQRFRELLDFKKINGHTNVPRAFGRLGQWVSHQRTKYRIMKEGKYSPLTSDKCKKLENIGFAFISPPTYQHA